MKMLAFNSWGHGRCHVFILFLEASSSERKEVYMVYIISAGKILALERSYGQSNA